MMLAQTHPTAPRAGLHCDFCHAAGQPLLSYPCRPFELQLIRRGAVLVVRQCTCCPSDYRPDPRDRVMAAHVSLDAWGACPACAALLDQAAVDQLGQRMIACLVGADVRPAHRPLVARQVIATLHAFWRHRLPTN